MPISKSRMCCKPIHQVFFAPSFIRCLIFSAKVESRFVAELVGSDRLPSGREMLGKAIVAKHSPLNSLICV